jgi:hypothetical protein
VAPHLRGVREEHPDLATCLLAPAAPHRGLVMGHDVYPRFTSVDPPTRSSCPTASMRAVVAASRDAATTQMGEVTWSQALMTLVGY